VNGDVNYFMAFLSEILIDFGGDGNFFLVNFVRNIKILVFQTFVIFMPLNASDIGKFDIYVLLM
jgi:hypothetical protein